MSPHRPVTLIGAGRVGLVLARALQTSSTFRVTAVWDPSSVACERARQELGEHVDLPSEPDTAVKQADTVVIAVPDDHLHDVARTLGAHGDWTSTLAVHTSGRYGTEAILPLGVAGADLAAVHPAMTFRGSLEVETERIRHAHSPSRPARHERVSERLPSCERWEDRPLRSSRPNARSTTRPSPTG